MVVVWLLFSGYYTVFILSLGAISVVATVYIVLRMETLDHESHPVHLTWSVFSYIPWLILEIIKANLDVAKRVISGGSSIDPAVIRGKVDTKNGIGSGNFCKFDYIDAGYDNNAHRRRHSLGSYRGAGSRRGFIKRRYGPPCYADGRAWLRCSLPLLGLSLCACCSLF